MYVFILPISFFTRPKTRPESYQAATYAAGIRIRMLWTRRSFTPTRHFRHLPETEQKASVITRFARHAPHRKGGEEEKEKEDYTLRLVAIIV